MEGTLLDVFPFYRGKPGAEVHWLLGGTTSPVITFLDPRAEWSGENTDDVNFFRLFGAADRRAEVTGRFIAEVGDKLEGGEAAEILKALLRKKGVTVQPPRSAVWQFAVSNSSNGRPLSRTDWLRLTGEESPVKVGEPGSSARLAIPVHADDPAQNGRVVQVDGVFYILDSVEQGLPPLPKSTKPADPPRPPIVLPPPPPSSGAVSTRAINYRFGGREEIPLPVGAKSVAFKGALLLGGPVKDATRSPIISTKLGSKPKKGKRRFDAGTAVVNAKGGLAIEANDKPESAGGPPLPVGVPIPFEFEWKAGAGARATAAGRDAVIMLAVSADEGGVVVLGVERSTDPEADYVLLPEGSSLSGILTITLAAGQPGPVNPPADPPPPAVGNLLAFAKEGQADAAQNLGRWTALVNLLETMKP